MEFFQIDIDMDYIGTDVELYPYKPEAIERFNELKKDQSTDQQIRLFRVYCEERKFGYEILEESLKKCSNAAKIVEKLVDVFLALPKINDRRIC
jgi:hypothetical protein